jgi:hypothetical protein
MASVIRKRIGLLAFGCLVACRHGASLPSSTVDAPPSVNQVVAYLDGAELQVETEQQAREVLRALEDLRTLSPSALAARRYAGYAMEPAIWRLPELLSKYFVPREMTPLNESALYRDAQDPKARAVVSRHIQAIQADRSPRPSYPPQ